LYEPRYFEVDELVDEDTYKKYGASALRFLDDRVLQAADICREIFGPLTINTWKWNGGYTDSGLRAPLSKTGAFFSAHRRGSALDLKSKYFNGEEMRSLIRRGLEGRLSSVRNNLIVDLLELINEIELGTDTWLHIGRTNRKENLVWIEYQ